METNINRNDPQSIPQTAEKYNEETDYRIIIY